HGAIVCPVRLSSSATYALKASLLALRRLRFTRHNMNLYRSQLNMFGVLPRVLFVAHHDVLRLSVHFHAALFVTRKHFYAYGVIRVERYRRNAVRVESRV